MVGSVLLDAHDPGPLGISAVLAAHDPVQPLGLPTSCGCWRTRVTFSVIQGAQRSYPAQAPHHSFPGPSLPLPPHELATRLPSSAGAPPAAWAPPLRVRVSALPPGPSLWPAFLSRWTPLAPPPPSDLLTPQTDPDAAPPLKPSPRAPPNSPGILAARREAEGKRRKGQASREEPRCPGCLSRAGHFPEPGQG